MDEHLYEKMEKWLECFGVLDAGRYVCAFVRFFFSFRSKTPNKNQWHLRRCFSRNQLKSHPHSRQCRSCVLDKVEKMKRPKKEKKKETKTRWRVDDREERYVRMYPCGRAVVHVLNRFSNHRTYDNKRKISHVFCKSREAFEKEKTKDKVAFQKFSLKNNNKIPLPYPNSVSYFNRVAKAPVKEFKEQMKYDFNQWSKSMKYLPQNKKKRGRVWNDIVDRSSEWNFGL